MAPEQQQNEYRTAAMRGLLRSYLTSMWMPTALALLLLGGFLTLEAVPGPVWLIDLFVILLAISLCFMLMASIHQFYSSSWRKGLLRLFFLTGVGIVSLPPLTFLAWFGHWKDPFGRFIVIPPDMVVETPLERVSESHKSEDVEGIEFRIAVNSGDETSSDTTVPLDLRIMNNFVGENRSLLLRHLASSAKWYVTEEFGEVYAYRRMVTEYGRWEDSLWGYYTDHDFDSWHEKYFHFRIVLGPDGPVLHEPWRSVATVVTVGSGETKVKVEKSVNRGNESYLIVQSDGPALEILEDSDILPRPFTALALSKIDTELTALWRSEMARAQSGQFRRRNLKRHDCSARPTDHE